MFRSGVCLGIGGQVDMLFQIVMTDMVRSGIQKLEYDMGRPAILKGHLVGLCVGDNW